MNEILYKKKPLWERALCETLWHTEHWRKGELIDYSIDTNLCVYQGLDELLKIMFTGGTQIALANWYIAIFNTNTTPTNAQTYAVPVYTEETEYDSATRPQWQGGTVASRSVTNDTNKATFVFNATSASNTIYGGALLGGVGADVKGNTADADGRMYSCSLFAAGKLVEDNDTLKITIQISDADA